MLNFTHLLVGAAIASKVNPVLGLPLAFVSHFALDAIPHYDGAYPKRPYQLLPMLQLAADFLIGIVVLARLTAGRADQSYLVIAALVAILPDVQYGLHYNYGIGKLFRGMMEFHERIQLPLRPPPYFVTTVATTLIAIWFLVS